MKLVAYTLFILMLLFMTGCETVPPSAYDQAEAAIFNSAFGTSAVAQPTKKFMFIP